MKLFSIRDRISKLYGEPHFFINSQVAVRDLAYTVNDPSSEGVPFTDLELYFVGEFDQNSGRFESANDFICTLSDLIKPVKESENNEFVSEE